MFNTNLFEKYDFTKYEKADIIRTLTEYTAWSIAENIRLFASENSTIVVSGGGSHNSFLLQLLSKYLKKSVIVVSEDIGINSDAKEAICFAFLAYLLLIGECGNLSSVTGASREAVLGVIAI